MSELHIADRVLQDPDLAALIVGGAAIVDSNNCVSVPAVLSLSRVCRSWQAGARCVLQQPLTRISTSYVHDPRSLLTILRCPHAVCTLCLDGAAHLPPLDRAGVPSLTSLSLCGSSIADIALAEALSAVLPLRNLSLSGARRAGYQTLRAIMPWRSLRQLDLSCMSGALAAPLHLAATYDRAWAERLTHLDLSEAHCGAHQVSQRLVGCCAATIESLVLDYCFPALRDAQMLAGALSSNASFGPTAWEPFGAGAARLTRLSIAGCALSAAVLQVVEGCDDGTRTFAPAPSCGLALRQARVDRRSCLKSRRWQRVHKAAPDLPRSLRAAPRPDRQQRSGRRSDRHCVARARGVRLSRNRRARPAASHAGAAGCVAARMLVAVPRRPAICNLIE